MIPFKKKQECETGPISGRYSWESVRVSGEGKGGWIWSMYFICLYDNRMMQSVEIVLRGVGGMR
jgi:hypothetical protein